MDSFIRYENTLFLEYNSEKDYYWISFDSGSSFPYELYEYVSVDGVEHYIIYLEDKEDVPSSAKDVWIDLDDVLSFVRGYKPLTDEGAMKMKELRVMLEKVLSEL